MHNFQRARVEFHIIAVLVFCFWAAMSSAPQIHAADSSPGSEPKVEPKTSVAIPIADVHLGQPVNFAKDVLPIFRSNCLACHNARESKGGLVLETPKSIRTGGESGPAAVAGNPDKSLLLRAASHAEKPFMPPRNNKVSALPLTPEQLGILKLWIAQGAAGDETLRAAPIQWHPLPATLNPIYAVAVTPDGQYAACGRANQIFIYDLPARRLVTRLTDPALIDSLGKGQPGLAHRDLVQSLAFSADGMTLASGGYREVKLWSRPRPAVLATLADAHAKNIGSLAQSADGKVLAVAGDDYVIRLYSMPEGKLLKSLTGHTGKITGFGFTSDGARLFSGSLDKTIRVWFITKDGDPSVIEAPGEILALAILGNGQVVTSGDDKLLHLWEDGKEIRKITNNNIAITLLAAVPDGSARFLAGNKSGVSLWDAGTGKTLRSVDQSGDVTAITIRADGKQCAVIGSAPTARIYSLEENRQPVQARGDREANDLMKLCERRLAFANREVTFAKNEVDDATKRQAAETQSISQTTNDVNAAQTAMIAAAKAFEAKTAAKVTAEKALAEATQAVADATKAKEAAEAASTAATAAVDAFRPALLKARAAVDAAAKGDAQKAAASALAAAEKTNADLRSKVNAAATALDTARQKLAVAMGKRAEVESRTKDAAKQAVEAENLAMQAEIVHKSAKQTLAAAKKSLEQAKNDLVAGKALQQTADAQLVKAKAESDAAQKAAQTAGGPMSAVALGIEGGTLLTGGEDGTLRTWSADSGAPAQTLRDSKKSIVAMTAGPQGIVACARADGSVQIWDIAGAWKLARTIGTGSEDSPLVSRVCAVAFSPDGSTLATGGGIPSRTGELKLWSVSDGKLSRELVDAHSDTAFGISFSADGKYVASCSADKFLKVFTVADGKLARSLEGHTEHVLSVSFRYDGRAIATTGADNRLRFWNMVTGEQKPEQRQFTWPLQVTSVNYIGFSDILLVTAGDGTVRLIREEGTVRNLETKGAFVHCSAVTPDGATLLAGGHDSILRMWDTRDGQPSTKFEPPEQER